MSDSIWVFDKDIVAVEWSSYPLMIIVAAFGAISHKTIAKIVMINVGSNNSIIGSGVETVTLTGNIDAACNKT